MTSKTTNIFEFATGAINLITDPVLADAYVTVTKYMDAVEELGALKGEDKLKWVLAKLPEVITDFFRLKTKIIAFIEKIKASYNLVRDLFN